MFTVSNDYGGRSGAVETHLFNIPHARLGVDIGIQPAEDLLPRLGDADEGAATKGKGAGVVGGGDLVEHGAAHLVDAVVELVLEVGEVGAERGGQGVVRGGEAFGAEEAKGIRGRLTAGPRGAWRGCRACRARRRATRRCEGTTMRKRPWCA